MLATLGRAANPALARGGRRRPLRDLPRRARRAGARVAYASPHGARGRAEGRGVHRRRRRLQLFSVGVLVALGLMSAVTVFALDQRSEARDQAQEARAHELEALARGAFDSDPELGLLLAREAALLSPGPTAEDALRDALRGSRVRSVVDLGEPVVGVFTRGTRLVGATSDGSVITVGRGGGGAGRRSRRAVEAIAASFSDEGTALLTDRRVSCAWFLAAGRPSSCPPSRELAERSSPATAGSRWPSTSSARGSSKPTRATWSGSSTARGRQPRPSRATAACWRPARRQDRAGLGHADRGTHSQAVRPRGRDRRRRRQPHNELVASASRDGIARVWGGSTEAFRSPSSRSHELSHRRRVQRRRGATLRRAGIGRSGSGRSTQVNRWPYSAGTRTR